MSVYRCYSAKKTEYDVECAALTRQLRELEEDGFLCRTVYGEVPPRVEYRLSPLGESFAPLLHAMLRWSEEHLEELGGTAPEIAGKNRGE